MVIAPKKDGVGPFVLLADEEFLPANMNTVKTVVMRRGPSTNFELKIVKEFGMLADPELLKPEEPSVCNYDGEVPPIHQHADGGWWFYEASFTFERGPFTSREAANVALVQYCDDFQKNSLTNEPKSDII